MQHPSLVHRAAVLVVVVFGVFGTVATSKAQPKITWRSVGASDVDVSPHLRASGGLDCNDYRCRGLTLRVDNTGDDLLVIDWEQTRYLYNDGDAGTFVVDDAAPTKPTTILPHTSLSVTLTPRAVMRDAVSRAPLDLGKSGIALVARHGDVVERATLRFEIVNEP